MLGVKSTSTVSDYFSYFEQTYLISFVPRFSYSYKAQLLNPKKVYCVDNGVVSIASPSFTRDEGRRLENMVFAELRRRYSEIFYYNENQKECDFIIAENSVPCLAIQVCYSLTAENRKREVEGLLDALTFFNLRDYCCHLISVTSLLLGIKRFVYYLYMIISKIYIDVYFVSLDGYFRMATPFRPYGVALCHKGCSYRRQRV